MVPVDLALGTLAYLFVALCMNLPFDAALWAFGMAMAVLPDWDFLPFLLLQNRRAGLHSHRQIGHFPLPYVAASAVLVAWNPAYGFTALLATAAHFAHDLSDAWGIAVAWPFWRGRIACSFHVLAPDAVPEGWATGHARFGTTFKERLVNRVIKRMFLTSKAEAAFVILALITLAIFVLTTGGSFTGRLFLWKN